MLTDTDMSTRHHHTMPGMRPGCTMYVSGGQDNNASPLSCIYQHTTPPSRSRLCCPSTAASSRMVYIFCSFRLCLKKTKVGSLAPSL